MSNAGAIQFAIAADHPCLAGHFPGRPVVPAVVLLERTFEAVRHRLPSSARLLGISNAKFLLPVLPEQTVSIDIDLAPGANTLAFRCTTAAGVAAQGCFIIGAGQ